MPEAAKTLPKRIPENLKSWIQNPVPDRKLGEKIIKEMSNHTQLLEQMLEF